MVALSALRALAPLILLSEALLLSVEGFNQVSLRSLQIVEAEPTTNASDVLTTSAPTDDGTSGVLTTSSPTDVGTTSVATADDKCRFTQAPTADGQVVLPISDLLDCANSLKIAPGHAELTLTTVSRALEGIYQFSDVNPTTPGLKVKAPFPHWTVLNITNDWQAELKKLNETVGTSSFKLHSSLHQLYRNFYDAHTLYISGFPFNYFRPYTFLVALGEGRCSPNVTLLPLTGEAAIAGYKAAFPNAAAALSSISGKSVVSINKVPVLDYIQSIGDELGTYKDKGVRFNNVVLSSSLQTMRLADRSEPWPENYEEVIEFSDGTSATLTLGGLISGVEKPLTSAQELQTLVDSPSERATLFAKAINFPLEALGLPPAAGGDNNTTANTTASPLEETKRRRKQRLLDENTSAGEGPKVLAQNAEVTFLFEVDGVPVLKQTSFQCELPACDPGTQFDIVRQAVALAKESPKKSLIVDLAENGGGYIWHAYAFLNLLRPHIFKKEPSKLLNSFDLVLSDFYNEFFSLYGDISKESVAKSPVTAEQAKEVAENIEAIIAIAGVTLPEPLPKVENIEALKEAVQGYRLKLAEELDTSINGVSPLIGSVWKAPDLSDIKNVSDYVYTNKRAIDRGTGSKFHTAKFLLTGSENIFNNKTLLPEIEDTSDINITFLTDGRCGSACSMFLTQATVLQLGPVVSLGGYINQPLDASSFGGGSVRNDKDNDSLLAELRKYYLIYYLATFKSLSDKAQETVLPLFSKTIATYAWLGVVFDGATLPIEYYQKPAHYQLPLWAVPSLKNVVPYSLIVSGAYKEQDAARGKCGYVSTGFPGPEPKIEKVEDSSAGGQNTTTGQQPKGAQSSSAPTLPVYIFSTVIGSFLSLTLTLILV